MRRIHVHVTEWQYAQLRLWLALNDGYTQSSLMRAIIDLWLDENNPHVQMEGTHD